VISTSVMPSAPSKPPLSAPAPPSSSSAISTNLEAPTRSTGVSAASASSPPPAPDSSWLPIPTTPNGAFWPCPKAISPVLSPPSPSGSRPSPAPPSPGWLGTAKVRGRPPRSCRGRQRKMVTAAAQSSTRPAPGCVRFSPPDPVSPGSCDKKPVNGGSDAAPSMRHARHHHLQGAHGPGKLGLGTQRVR
jgi:hypothetical protein